MDTNIKATDMLQKTQTGTDSDSAERGNVPTFHLQTGLQAGAFGDGQLGFGILERVEEMLNRMQATFGTNF